ncbi:hypothetical protein E3P99_00607 [Wallemia hederae]|uniref:Conserved oligomeric Golgi complex subunit 1 n=1 Tax=Wallemia hederae TaxID=1540922 RepID=A0A4V6TMG6_9BASI|nr:hypothetical protein E3P99_00607 [Wallemia hederae]
MSAISEIEQEIDKRVLMVQAIVGDRCGDVLSVSKSMVELERGLGEMQRVADSIRELYNSDKPQIPPPSASIDPIPALVKVVHDASENIWRFMENDQHLNSAWLYSLARITHMQLSNSYPDTLNQLVILKSQHESTLQLKQQIVIRGVISLIRQSISYNDALKTLTGLILLDSPTYDHSLLKFLHQRSTALNHIQNSTSAELVISQSLQLINETHNLVERLYVQCGLSDYIEQCSQNAADVTTKSLINQLSGSEIILHRIPNQLLNYTPYFAPFDKLSEQTIREALDVWTKDSLDSLRTLLDPQSGLLSNIKSISDLCPLRAIVEVTDISSVRNFFVGVLEERCQLLWTSLHSDYLETTHTKINKAISTVTHIPNARNDPITNLLAPLPHDFDTTSFNTKYIPLVSDVLELVRNQSANIHRHVVDFVIPPDTNLQSQALLSRYREESRLTLERFEGNLSSTFDSLLQNEQITQRKRQLMVLRQLVEAFAEEKAIESNILLDSTSHIKLDDFMDKVTKRWAEDVVSEHLKADDFVWTECELDADESRWEVVGDSKIPQGPSYQLFELLRSVAHDVSNASLHVVNKQGMLKEVLVELSQRILEVFSKQEEDSRANVRKWFDAAFLAVICGYSGVDVEVKVDEEMRSAMMDVASDAVLRYQLMLGALINAPEKPATEDGSGGAAGGITNKHNPLLRLGQPKMKMDLNSMIVPTVDLKPRINLLAL